MNQKLKIMEEVAPKEKESFQVLTFYRYFNRGKIQCHAGPTEEKKKKENVAAC